ncbi:ras-associating and dilute domain-containing protein isoform X2 [Myiozetetes cayanensis]|uniref:ras-associating and dilute domain-containing protein isoform X2 n=1 Tax=Myiozetetes cayanensis TaxID=478635 RepID=UPI002160C419|nr:ras-associating and dilute domain-containing protein isoform X2 [Myiozetetes cayanensis]
MEGKKAREKDGKLCFMTTSRTMFYGPSSTMAPPSKNRLKRQSRLFSQVLYRTLSYKDRSSASASPAAGEDDPAELSTQLSAPGILKIFGGNICAGTNYKSVLVTGSSGARELVKEALERYGLSQLSAGQYALCDVIGRFEGPEKQWQTEGLRVLGDHEKPLLIQDLWKPREGFSRRLELRRRAEVEELAAKDVDTTTAGINAQARKLQRHRARGARRAAAGAERRGAPPALRRSLSETSLGTPARRAGTGAGAGAGSWLQRHCSTLPGSPAAARSGGSMRYSLYQSPHLLLLQGYSQQHDSLVYLLNREQHTVGQRTQASKPSISLSAPDILPLHCTIRKLRPSRHRSEEKLVLEPIAGASISVNFAEVARTVVLRHGDLLSLGLYYLLLYKDPMKAQPLPAQTLLRLRALHPAAPEGRPVCGACGSLLREKDPAAKKQGPSPAGGPRTPRRKLQLEFEPAAEDMLLWRIMTLIEPGGDDHKLTPAFLLCLCIQHSATSFEPGDFGQLLLKVAKMIHRTERTQELSEKQSQHQDPASLSRFTITDLLPDLQHIIFWMANAIEILYFVQQKSPTYIQSMEEELDIRGSKESLFSSTITASEEAMTVLEEVIMYTFQQCVYYISKCLYVSLPALLECNPFQSECRESWRAAPALPEDLRRVVLIYQAVLDLLHQYEVHPEITSQMFAYLFFFSNTLLFNQLLDKGSSLGCFHWSQGVKLRASVRLLLDWLRGAGFEQLAQQFFAKLASVANLLAMPGSQLVQMTWPSLRAEFPALSPAQLHRVLSQCQAVMDTGCVAAWQPSEEESPATFQPDEMLESFDNHPPIILPSGGFKVDLEVETLDDNIYRHLLYIRHFLWSLQSKSPHTGEGPGSAPTKSVFLLKKEACKTPEVLEVSESPAAALGSTTAQEDYCSPGGCAEPEPEGSPQPCLATNGCPCEHHGEPQIQEKLKQLQLGRSPAPKAGTAPTDSSCLLTPPTTPLNFDSGSPESPQGTGKGLQDPRRNGMNGTKGSTPEGCSPTPYDYPTPESSSRSSATDDFCYVFVVELERGPIGLGMGLIDGVHTPLCSPGIYIRTLIEDSPAAADGRLSIGDRILAVNGTSLIGADYQSAVDLIRSGGKKLRFLVAKSDTEIAKKISSSSSVS